MNNFHMKITNKKTTQKNIDEKEEETKKIINEKQKIHKTLH